MPVFFLAVTAAHNFPQREASFTLLLKLTILIRLLKVSNVSDDRIDLSSSDLMTGRK